tara:strand:- start:2633 stop:3013 length:381 start_codon:yes stop_codon:yes gene_type:complete
MSKLITISELSKKLNLINPKNKKPLNHVLRYWESEFKLIKPKIINKRRYYTNKQIEYIKLIKYLLKDQGMTIKGVKNVLNSKVNDLDEGNIDSLKANLFKKRIKDKSNLLLKKIENLKNYGKKKLY